MVYFSLGMQLVQVVMSTTFYEIVVLADGDFALRRTDEPEEPLIRIHFSDETKGLLQDASFTVVKAMIDAGIDMVEKLGDKAPEPAAEGEPRTIH